MLVEVPGGKPELVLNLAGSSSKIIGIDPATGKKLWSCDGNNDGYVCSSVVSHDGVVFASRRPFGPVRRREGRRLGRRPGTLDQPERFPRQFTDLP